MYFRMCIDVIKLFKKENKGMVNIGFRMLFWQGG